VSGPKGYGTRAQRLWDEAQPQCDLVRTFRWSEINDPFAPCISVVFGAARDGAGARVAWDVDQGSLRGDITLGSEVTIVQPNGDGGSISVHRPSALPTLVVGSLANATSSEKT
jgi:hypothetical protein